MPTFRARIFAVLVFAAAIRFVSGSSVAFHPVLEATLDGLKAFGEGSSIFQGANRRSDGFTNILAEVQSDQFSNALAKAFLRRLGRTSIPEHKLLVCTNAFSRGEVISYLAYRKSPTNASAVNLLRACIEWYVDTRSRHCLAYARDSMLELAAPTPQPLLLATEEKLVRFHHIPPGWLKHSLTNGPYYVVDGPPMGRSPGVTTRPGPPYLPSVRTLRSSILRSGRYVTRPAIQSGKRTTDVARLP